MDLKLFGKKIREKRKERGLTNQEMADTCNMHEGYLRQVENGSKLPALPLLVKICEVLHTSPNYLFGFTEEENVKDILEDLYSLSPYQLRAVKHLIKSFVSFERNENSSKEE